MSDLGYAGDIDSRRAAALLGEAPGATLIDVRTAPEWEFVGRPDLSGWNREAVLISWQTYPGMILNGSFVEAVRDAGVDATEPVLLLCRSGQRSRHAAIALTENGFEKCFNISDGFEGPKDAKGHRGTVAGWRANGLPWVQG